MSVLALRLAGPLQSWGTSSRYARRDAGREPSKSGLVGLIAAAQGRRRSDPVEDLVALRLGVRSDQPGRLVRDYQTARHPSWSNAALSTRYYLGDAVFLAVVEAERSLLEGIDEAIRSPRFPLYLGRRSCPPSGPVSLGVRDTMLREALTEEPWLASEWWQRKTRTSSVRLLASMDSSEPGDSAESRASVRDVPVSFDQERREYTWRTVTRCEIDVINEFAPAGAQPNRFGDLDPWSAVEA
ncbi:MULTISPECIES: type I-E CRISPR-associated protein Cas5/CasD [unclassified Rathayibacter]|uniref:type I-E CRISPR-associated protein Cas5/CasD n=1 Tax=unclassified Rathayibacter TaxID=2609250 RepID=UPI001889C621|nr:MULTISPECIES: type I-E CRISPR-associated protein Cas5/CasD [unclassified Rathayibacter]MBF4460962.1 type I-E CRISPR-associated protein Cas5/CasD [Rathayibacter sp. VKM Ac-2879]MBF4502373.1 type I-E CRISPR-associated protein Cas5/CasD [Rathayibacter sp. VKM Ac-2878]